MYPFVPVETYLIASCVYTINGLWCTLNFNQLNESYCRHATGPVRRPSTGAGSAEGRHEGRQAVLALSIISGVTIPDFYNKLHLVLNKAQESLNRT